MDPERDIQEFKRLRNYYRKEFQNGESDESFVNWCEVMCEESRKEEKS